MDHMRRGIQIGASEHVMRDIKHELAQSITRFLDFCMSLDIFKLPLRRFYWCIEVSIAYDGISPYFTPINLDE